MIMMNNTPTSFQNFLHKFFGLLCSSTWGSKKVAHSRVQFIIRVKLFITLILIITIAVSMIFYCSTIAMYGTILKTVTVISNFQIKKTNLYQ